RGGLLDRLCRHLAIPFGGFHRRQEPRRGDLLVPELGLDAGDDSLAGVRMLAQERGRVLPALAESFFVEAEVRAGLLDGLPLEPGIEHSALPGDPGAVD